MLQNAYLFAKLGADTAENERNFAKNWQLPYPARRSRAPRRGSVRAPAPRATLLLRVLPREEGAWHPAGGSAGCPCGESFQEIDFTDRLRVKFRHF